MRVESPGPGRCKRGIETGTLALRPRHQRCRSQQLLGTAALRATRRAVRAPHGPVGAGPYRAWPVRHRPRRLGMTPWATNRAMGDAGDYPVTQRSQLVVLNDHRRVQTHPSLFLSREAAPFPPRAAPVACSIRRMIMGTRVYSWRDDLGMPRSGDAEVMDQDRHPLPKLTVSREAGR